MFKKFVSVFLCFVTVFTVTAAALVSDGGITAEAASYSLPYYYNQLSDDAQEFYVCLRNAIIDHKSRIKLEMDFSDDVLAQVAELLVFHDPLTFNITDVTYIRTSGNAAVFTPEYKYNKETYEKMVSSYNKKAKKILNKLTDDMSTYKKIKTIHDSIIKDTVYDLDAKNNENIYGTLVKNKAKCDGYAKTFVYICGKAGIRAVTVPGVGTSETSGNKNDNVGHMWNKVYYNKKWYNVDVTWDDPASDMKDNLQYDYFMVSDKEFSKTHKEEAMGFTIPKASDNSKTYYKVYKKYAETEDDAVELIRSELNSAVKSGKTSISVKCSSKEVMNYADSKLNDKKYLEKLFKELSKSSDGKLADVYYYCDDDTYKIKMMIFYKDTKLSEYFLEPDKVKSSTRKELAKYGIT